MYIYIYPIVVPDFFWSISGIFVGHRQSWVIHFRFLTRRSGVSFEKMWGTCSPCRNPTWTTTSWWVPSLCLWRIGKNKTPKTENSFLIFFWRGLCVLTLGHAGKDRTHKENIFAMLHGFLAIEMVMFKPWRLAGISHDFSPSEMGSSPSIVEHVSTIYWYPQQCVSRLGKKTCSWIRHLMGSFINLWWR